MGHNSAPATVLDDFKATNPLGFRDLFKRVPRPSALQLAMASLEVCDRELLNQKQLREYHDAMVGMLEKRRKRLAEDIKRLGGTE